MKRIVLLTAKYLNGETYGNELLAQELSKMGYSTSFKCWDDFEDEGEDLFVLRSTWNYTEHLAEFLAFCRKIGPRLVNSLAVVEWNSNKRYLLELADKGLPVLPMHIVEDGQGLKAAVAALQESEGATEFVAKPLVSASAKGLFAFTQNELPEITQPMIIQKLHKEIQGGEISLMYFDGKYEFSVMKTPQKGEFRVQAGYGGVISHGEATAEQRQLAEDALALIPEPTAYTRVDIVPGVGLIELECIEPGLFFQYHDNAAKACALAIAKRLS